MERAQANPITYGGIDSVNCFRFQVMHFDDYITLHTVFARSDAAATTRDVVIIRLILKTIVNGYLGCLEACPARKARSSWCFSFVRAALDSHPW